MTSRAQAQHSINDSHVRQLRLFTATAHVLWGAVFAATIFLEVMPVPPMQAAIFYAFLACKLIAFLLLGFLAPLTFWAFDSLGRGLLFSCVAALLTEFLQHLSPGHSTSLYEFAGKACLLLLGFTLALSARYDMQISLGPIHIELLSPVPKSR